ncbi:hypothetical protein CJ030_MR5G001033 [Morella rubra]|uniref:Uncharacterized protein n=1 Tax=Morella rubra TaxID=262757 RepID=A0A6A1VHZ6_9ROSI|nr:hypothetical protein CJ030_MR5G001033 [Morella rubra]
MSPKCCIFRVPNILYRQNKEAFTPDAFSIGPLHHGHPNLKATEQIKFKYLQCLIARSKTGLIELISSLKDLEIEARDYYAEPIRYTPEEFVKMLVIDGCFIIELFRKDAYEELREKDDPIFSMSYTKHIVDLLRTWMLSSITEEEKGEGWELVPSATSLAEAGIKFARGTSQSILDIKFIDGVLIIPQLQVQETTETVFRNLISFEQCYANCEARVTSYAILIDNLINTTKDVEILCENEIIDNWLNPEDAVQFFNKLYYHSFVRTFYYGSLCNKVNIYCRHRWPRWRTVLVRNYLNTPWAMLSTLAAIVLLVLTFLQTLYTMKA